MAITYLNGKRISAPRSHRNPDLDHVCAATVPAGITDQLRAIIACSAKQLIERACFRDYVASAPLWRLRTTVYLRSGARTGVVKTGPAGWLFPILLLSFCAESADRCVALAVGPGVKIVVCEVRGHAADVPRTPVALVTSGAASRIAVWVFHGKFSRSACRIPLPAERCRSSRTGLTRQIVRTDDLDAAGMQQVKSGVHNRKIREERCRSGRTGLTRNQVYGFPVPWVRIPPSPPILNGHMDLPPIKADPAVSGDACQSATSAGRHVQLTQSTRSSHRRTGRD